MTSTLPHRSQPRRATCPVPASGRRDVDRPEHAVPRGSTSHALVDRFAELAARPARHGRALRREGQPPPALLAALRGRGCRFDVASPAEVRAGLRRGGGAGGPRLLQPGQAPRPHRGGGRAGACGCSSWTRSRRPARSPRPPPAARCCAGSSRRARGRTGRCRASTAARTYEAVEILTDADELGLDAAGISFHVGSQQRDPEAWASPVAAAARASSPRASGVSALAARPRRRVPGSPRRRLPPLAAYGEAVEPASPQLRRPTRPRTLVEPGRASSATPATLVTTVIAVLHRGDIRWVYLDAGVFTGMVETLDEAIRYRLVTVADGGPTGPCVLAGPTCDSADVLYENQLVPLPLALAEGDQVRLLSAGAYSTCYSTVGFNGFDPMPTVLGRDDPAGAGRAPTPAVLASHALAPVRCPCPGRCCWSSSPSTPGPEAARAGRLRGCCPTCCLLARTVADPIAGT